MYSFLKPQGFTIYASLWFADDGDEGVAEFCFEHLLFHICVFTGGLLFCALQLVFRVCGFASSVFWVSKNNHPIWYATVSLSNLYFVFHVCVYLALFWFVFCAFLVFIFRVCAFCSLCIYVFVFCDSCLCVLYFVHLSICICI